MTIKTTEIVSLTVPEWNLLDSALRLLDAVVSKTSKDTDINERAIAAADALDAFMDEIYGC